MVYTVIIKGQAIHTRLRETKKKMAMFESGRKGKEGKEAKRERKKKPKKGKKDGGGGERERDTPHIAKTAGIVIKKGVA